MTHRIGEIVGRGSRSRVHAFGAGAVIKVPELSTPSSWIECEARFSEAVREAGAPVPRLLGLEHVGGRTASVWERVSGPSMWDWTRQRPSRLVEAGRLLADLQVGLFDLVPPIVLPRQQDRLVSKIRRAAAFVDPVLRRALDLMPARPSPARLCHGDLHPGNVIMSPDGPVLVDWFDASCGEAVADIARSTLVMLPADELPAHLAGATTAELTTVRDAYLDRVTTRLGVPDDLLRRWQAIEAAARIAEGVEPSALLAVWRGYQDTRLAGLVNR